MGTRYPSWTQDSRHRYNKFALEGIRPMHMHFCICMLINKKTTVIHRSMEWTTVLVSTVVLYLLPVVHTSKTAYGHYTVYSIILQLQNVLVLQAMTYQLILVLNVCQALTRMTCLHLAAVGELACRPDAIVESWNCTVVLGIVEDSAYQVLVLEYSVQWSCNKSPCRISNINQSMS